VLNPVIIAVLSSRNRHYKAAVGSDWSRTVDPGEGRGTVRWFPPSHSGVSWVRPRVAVVSSLPSGRVRCTIRVFDRFRVCRVNGIGGGPVTRRPFYLFVNLLKHFRTLFIIKYSNEHYNATFIRDNNSIESPRESTEQATAQTCETCCGNSRASSGGFRRVFCP